MVTLSLRIITICGEIRMLRMKCSFTYVILYIGETRLNTKPVDSRKDGMTEYDEANVAVGITVVQNINESYILNYANKVTSRC
jgi:hypothetical protein